MTEEKHDFLEDSDGNKSSKRLWGSLSVGLGLFLSIMLFCCCASNPTVRFDDCIYIVELLLGFGSLLLGLGLTEKFFKKQ